MRTSPLGIKKIAVREGTILRTYKDSKGLLTAGCGHLLSEGEKVVFPLGTRISQYQSDLWLSQDLREAENAVNSIGANLEQNEFDALVSLTFNIGVAGFKRSTVARRIKAGNKKGAAEAIMLWNKPPEIIGRRKTEYKQFLTPYQSSVVAPVVAQDKPSELDQQPSITPQVEQLPNSEQTVIEQQGESIVSTTTTASIPASDPPVKVSQNGGLAKWLVGSGVFMTLSGTAWQYATEHLDWIGISVICATVLILALVFRGVVTDALRMWSAASGDKSNVS